MDCLTYAGNLESLADIEAKFGSGAVSTGSTTARQRYFFEKVDITDRPQIGLCQL